MKVKFMFLLVFGFALSQTNYFGSLSFDYSGSMNGSFNAEFQADSTGFSLSGAYASTFEMEPSTAIFITAFEPADDESINVFASYLNDEDGELNPQEWEVGLFDPENFEDTDAVSIFIPELDSAYVMDLVGPLFNGEVDSSNFEEYLTGIATELMSISFVSTSGSVSLETISETQMEGEFDETMMMLGFPPPMIIVSNGVFELNNPLAELLPAAPENVSAEFVSDHVQLDWEYNGEVEVSSFYIYRGENDIFPEFFDEVDAANMQYNDAAVTSGFDYTYIVTGVTSLGVVGYNSDPVTITIPGDTGILGDVNADETVDVLDVVITVNIIMGTVNPTDYQLWAADMNEDNTVDVLDIVQIVNLIMEG